MTTNQSKSCNRVPMTLRDIFWQDPFFENTWKDFDSIRENIIKEDIEFKRKLSPILSNTEDAALCPPPRRNWMLSRWLSNEPGSNESLESNFGTLKLFNKDESTLKITDNDSKFEISLDTHQYRPDELQVNVDNATHILSIEGIHL